MNKLKYILIALTAFFAVSCIQDKVFEEITKVPLKRCLEPMNLSARVDANSGVKTTFRWDVTTDAEEYLLEVLDAATSNVVLSETLTGKDVPYVVNLEADGNYTFRVTAKSSALADSNTAVYDGSFKTYAIKDNLFLTVTGKSAEAVSLAWSKDVPDYTDVSHIEVTPTKGGSTKTVNLTDAQATEAEATVSGLAASTEYDFVLFFKSASRGAATVWTSPAQGSLTKVTTSEALMAAMTAGDDVYVGAEGSPYSVGSVTPAKGFRMLGEYAADGSKPVVMGDIALNNGFTGDIYLENIHFDGTGRSRIIDHKGGALSIDKISIVNCEISGYACGIYYDNVDGQLDLGEFLIEGCDIHDIAGSGGDGFDVRKNSAIGKIIFRNNTVWNSFRSFFRLDGSDAGTNVTLGEFVMENNTIKNSAVIDKGIFYIRCPWTKLTIQKNLFLHQLGDKAVMATTLNTKPENRPSDITAKDNYYFNVGSKFLDGATNFDAATLAATEVAEDPCFNSKGNFFNLANADLQDKKVGAAKWWNEYVEPVEDLTQGVTEAPHTWDFGNASLFAADLTKSKVRDNLLMVASEEFPMNLDGAVNFKKAAVLNKKGVPTDGYAMFIVEAPGSVILKAEADGTPGAQIIVAVGDEFGTEAIVKGSAVAGDPLQKVVVADITEKSNVYLYATAPVKLTTLSWSPDVAGANTALSAPKAAIDVVQITEGDETPITVTWEAVTNAADYTVNFNRKKTTTEELSFVIDAETAAALEAGLYTITVVANPAESDIYNTVSEEASVAFAVMAPAGSDEPVTVEKTLSWDIHSDEWLEEPASKGAAGSDITNWVSTVADATGAELTWTSTNKSKWNKRTINEVEWAYIQAGGKGSKTDRFFSFTAPAAGHLKVWASNTGNNDGVTDATRFVTVCVNDGEEQTVVGGTPANVAPTEAEFDVEAGLVKIYPTGNGLCFYKVEFTYLETSGGEPEPQKEDYVWDLHSDEWLAELTAKGAAGSDITNWVSTVADASGAELTWTSSNKSKWNKRVINEVEWAFIQAGGKGSKTDRFFSFTAPVAGTVKVWASNTGNNDGVTDTTRFVTVCVNDGEEQSIVGGSPANVAPTEAEFEVEAGVVKIYPTGNGLCFYKIEFHSK